VQSSTGQSIVDLKKKWTRLHNRKAGVDLEPQKRTASEKKTPQLKRRGIDGAADIPDKGQKPLMDKDRVVLRGREVKTLSFTKPSDPDKSIKNPSRDYTEGSRRKVADK